MTDEEKKKLVDAVITQLKNEGTDVSNASIVSNANGIDYVVAYGKNGQIVRAVPTAISSEKVGATGYMNAYTEAGVYNINTNGGEDLPIDNQGAISARLTVLVTESGGNKVITQVLNLNNNEGGEGNVYIRSCQNGEWKAWGKLQTNIEVGQVVEEEKSRAELAEQTINDKLDEEARRATQAEGEINQNTIAADSLGCSTTTDDISLDFETLDGRSPGSVTIPAATAESAGVMSAADKVKLNNSYKDIDVSPNEIDVELDIEDNAENTHHVVIPAATTEKAGVMSAEDKVSLDSIPNEIDKIKDGDTIVGQAREIHSRNGKTVTDSFLARTTAGSGTIGDGVASVKQIGGNIVKNMIDSVQYTNVTKEYIQKVENGIATTVDGNSHMVIWGLGTNPYIAGHIYYCNAVIYNENAKDVTVALKADGTGIILSAKREWLSVSLRQTITLSNAEVTYRPFMSISVDAGTCVHIKKWIIIDLTEMFGAGNEPDQATCDKLFGTMDALPQGLTIANPTEFKSIGFNQFNTENVLEGKAIVDNAIVSGDKKIAVIPCLPCKVGIGENNGYCIHGDFGDDIKVYLTPLNPMEVEGELYMHELTKDTITDTYVPLIKGYLLVEVPTTANLCAHFLWSEDKCERDSYEPYFESKIELPVIPQMSEWGLACIKSSSSIACDEVDLERGVYVKRIVDVDLGFAKLVRRGGKDNNVFWLNTNNTSFNEAIKSLAICGEYTVVDSETMYFNTGSYDRVIFIGRSGYFSSASTAICIRDSRFTDATALQEHLRGIKAYYYGTEEEYPLPKVDNNYISSDYGVEQFDSVVPCNANNLYYMRSLAGETRNFLDRMYDNTAKTDAKEVADYITNGIEGNKELATNAPNLALRALFVATGAEYNDTGTDKTKTAPWGETVTHKAGHYYLNGLGDITEEQMMEIYNAGRLTMNGKGRYAYNTKIRTLLPSYLCGQEGYDALALKAIFANAIGIEVAMLSTNLNLVNQFGVAITSDDISYSFFNCHKLKYIQDLELPGTNAKASSTFTKCHLLEYVKIRNLAINISFTASSMIKKESVIFIIKYAKPSSAITITLHPDAYARLNPDLEDNADIKSALEAQPLITLVSA